MLDVVHRFQERVGETKPVIVADAAMLSKDNMQKLEDELWLLRVSILLLQVHHVLAHFLGHLHFWIILRNFWSSTFSSSCPCCRQTGLGTLLNKAALKLSESAEDIEYHLAGCRSGINAAVIDRAESHSPFLQLFDNIDQVPE